MLLYNRQDYQDYYMYMYTHETSSMVKDYEISNPIILPDYRYAGIPDANNYFLQRVPYVSRTISSDYSTDLLSTRESLVLLQPTESSSSFFTVSEDLTGDLTSCNSSDLYQGIAP